MQVNAKLHAEYQAYIEDANPAITYQEWLEDNVISVRRGWLVCAILMFACAVMINFK